MDAPVGKDPHRRGFPEDFPEATAQPTAQERGRGEIAGATPSGARDHARALLHRAVEMCGSPEEIARGAAVGMLVAFTPTVGAQMVIAAALATAFHGNRAAAVMPVWITNPATILPIYMFTYRVGAWFLPGPTAESVLRRLDEATALMATMPFWRLDLHVAALAGVGWQVFAVLSVGGLVVGSVVGAVSYLAVVNLVRFGRAEVEALARRRKAAREPVEGVGVSRR